MAKTTVQVELDLTEITAALVEYAKVKCDQVNTAGGSSVEFRYSEGADLSPVTGATVVFQYTKR